MHTTGRVAGPSTVTDPGKLVVSLLKQYRESSPEKVVADTDTVWLIAVSPLALCAVKV